MAIKMYILIVSILCAVMLGAVRQISYDNLLENVVLTLLLFVVIDSGLRAIMNRPSWAVRLIKKK